MYAHVCISIHGNEPIWISVTAHFYSYSLPQTLSGPQFGSGATQSDLPATLLGGALDFSSRSMNQSNPVAAVELMGSGEKNRI